jgi:hypothetical protein
VIPPERAGKMRLFPIHPVQENAEAIPIVQIKPNAAASLENKIQRPQIDSQQRVRPGRTSASFRDKLYRRPEKNTRRFS